MTASNASPGAADAGDELQREIRTANGIYGVIVSSAVMASAKAQTVTRLAVAVLVTLVVYWAAERYAHLMARRIVAGPDVRWRDLRGRLRQGWELVTASFTPLLVMLAATLLGAEVTVAVLSALVAATGVLAVAGWQVGREAGLGLLPRFLSAMSAAAFGLVMIGLKALLH